VPCAIKAETAGNDLNAMELTARAESGCEAISQFGKEAGALR